MRAETREVRVLNCKFWRQDRNCRKLLKIKKGSVLENFDRWVGHLSFLPEKLQMESVIGECLQIAEVHLSLNLRRSHEADFL